MQTFQHLINALSLGSLYAAIAIGYTMVFSVLRLVNFAYDDGRLSWLPLHEIVFPAAAGCAGSIHGIVRRVWCAL